MLHATSGLMANSRNNDMEPIVTTVPDIEQIAIIAQSNDQPVAQLADTMDSGSPRSAKSPPEMTDIESSCENSVKPVDDKDLDLMMRDINELGELATGQGDIPDASTTQLPNNPLTDSSTEPWANFMDLDLPEMNFELPLPTLFGPYGASQHIESIDTPGNETVPGGNNDGPIQVGTPLDLSHSGKRPFEASVNDDHEASGNKEVCEDGQREMKRARPEYDPLAHLPAIGTFVPATRASSESEHGLSVMLLFSTPKGKTSYSDLVSYMVAHEVGRRDHRKLRARDAATTIDKVALARKFKNKPIARGCWACVQLEGNGDSQCSLLNDHGHYPCHACTQDGVRCELITPPLRKISCVDCRRHNLTCSYTYTRNHDQDCQQCSTGGHRCVADPAKDGIMPRIGIIRAETENTEEVSEEQSVRYVSTLPPPPKKGKAKVAEDCRECTHSGATCNYPTNLSSGPCRSCKLENLACTMPNAPAPKLSDFSRPTKPKPLQPKVVPQTKPKPATQMRRDSVLSRTETGRNSSRITRTMLTSYSHPMIFNSSAEDCDFCNEPDMQISGLGAVNPEIVDFPDTSGFAEIAGGHKEAGMFNTRLCGVCTTVRLSIVSCNPHELQQISGVQPSEKDNAAARTRLLDGEEQNVELHCHVCLRLASYTCCAANGEEDDEEDSGCGLKLCEPCAVRLAAANGDIPALIAEMMEEGQDCRADAELLRDDGALTRYLAWQRSDLEG